MSGGEMRERMTGSLVVLSGLVMGAIALSLLEPSASGVLTGVAITAASLLAARVLLAVSGLSTPNFATGAARDRATPRPAPSPQHPRTAGRPLTRAPDLEAVAA